MRRADRLFQIVTLLQGRRTAVTAREIAEEFGVCERTVYRDMQDLLLSGVPITGEAGVGYVLDARYHLPPIMFSPEEMEVLLLGIFMVESWTDDETGAVGRRALSKIKSVLGESDKRAFAEAALFAAESAAKVPWRVDFSLLRKAIRSRHKLKMTYRDDAGQKTQRTVRPLGLAFFAPVWVMVGWCELRDDFRNFRIDRMGRVQKLEERFTDERGKRLIDCLRREGLQDRHRL